MLKNLLLTAFRNLRKNVFFSLLNILGLAIGMMVFLLIAQYVKFERSYENFIPNRENIYRVSLESYAAKQLVLNTAENYPAVGPVLLNEVPGVMNYARLYNMGYKNNVVITNENARPQPIGFKQNRFLYADSAFLSMMGYEMKSGNAKTALGEPQAVVISEKYAKMYFGNEDPYGKVLHMRDDDFNDEQAKVTGVFKDLPSNTHLKFDVLFSYKTLYQRGSFGHARYDQSWKRQDMYTFIQLKPGTNPREIESKLPAIIDKYKPELKQNSKTEILRLQPLKSIHLQSDLAEEAETNGNGNIVFFISLIGIFVLVIAWINYINLSTARAIGRAKEVGVRKVVGAYKYQLILQFLAESAVVNFLSIIIAYGLSLLVLSSFNTLSGLSLNVLNFQESWFILLMIALWLIGSLLSGFYPAWVLSSFKPVTVLKGKLKNSKGGLLLRKGLVVSQFMASVALIAGTIIVYKQIHFMLNRDLGININQVLTMDRPGNAPGQRSTRNVYFGAIDMFRAELQKSSDIKATSLSLTIPGKQREYKVDIKRLGNNTADSAIVRVNTMDYEFFDVFKMKLLAGRFFSKAYPKDPDTSMILTATASKLLGFKKPADAIGQSVVIPQFGTSSFIIAGVVNDYHQVSFKKALDPSIFLCSPYDGEYFSLRINTGHLSKTVAEVEAAWTKAFPGTPFSYFFLDDYFNRQYANEQKFGKLFTSFAILAIILSCLGLFGLSAYTASQRVREIGIHKVLGASVFNVTSMLSTDFLKLVIWSILIATPVIWMIMYYWLQSFAYRIDINWWIFPLAGVIALVIALVTVSYQAIKAALANPVQSLRSE